MGPAISRGLPHSLIATVFTTAQEHVGNVSSRCGFLGWQSAKSIATDCFEAPRRRNRGHPAEQRHQTHEMSTPMKKQRVFGAGDEQVPCKVSIVGSGNWGSAMAKIVGTNAARHEHLATEVRMWVYEEMIEGRKLSEIINKEHENVKYLKGVKLPENVVAVPDIEEACRGANVLVSFVRAEHPRICTFAATLPAIDDTMSCRSSCSHTNS